MRMFLIRIEGLWIWMELLEMTDMCIFFLRVPSLRIHVRGSTGSSEGNSVKLIASDWFLRISFRMFHVAFEILCNLVFKFAEISRLVQCTLRI